MPGNDTHAAVGGAGAAVVDLLIGLPIAWWVVPVAAATIASPWPDRLERVPRKLWQRTRTRWPNGNLDRRLRRLQVHRGWTHWIPSTAVAVAIAVGAATAGALLGLVALVLLAVEAAAGSHTTMPTEALTYAPWVGLLAALGAFVGYALHSYLDGWTDLGSPMWGIPGRPRTQRRRHAVPGRKRRGKPDPRLWIDEDDEAALRRWAPRVIVLCVVLHYRADLWPLAVQLYDAIAGR